MSETTIEISKSSLEEWIEKCKDAQNPQIRYSSDPKETLKRAYKVRGDVLAYIRGELSSCITIHELS